MTELVWFTRWRWRGEFRRAHLTVLEEQSLHLFTSGEQLTRLPVAVRRKIASVLGATSRAYLVGVRPESGGS